MLNELNPTQCLFHSNISGITCHCGGSRMNPECDKGSLNCTEIGGRCYFLADKLRTRDEVS